MKNKIDVLFKEVSIGQVFIDPYGGNYFVKQTPVSAVTVAPGTSFDGEVVQFMACEDAVVETQAA